jgi:hypothetical protein
MIIASLCTLSPCVIAVASSGVVPAFIVLGWLLFLEFLAAVEVIWIPWAAPTIFQITQEATCKSAAAHKKPTRPPTDSYMHYNQPFVCLKRITSQSSD